MLLPVLVCLIIVVILEGATASHHILLLLEYPCLVIILSLCVLSACIILLAIAILFFTLVFILAELSILLVYHPVRLGCLHHRTSPPIV